jgi:hypothetical protein
MKPPEEKLAPRKTHGVHGLKRAIKTLGARSIDRRTTVGRHHAEWRGNLIDALGGVQELTPQKIALIDEVVLTKLILDSINAWIVSQPTLINKRSRSVITAVRDRSGLVSVLRMLLGDLGLERKATRVLSLTDYLNGNSTATPPQAGSTKQTKLMNDEAASPTPGDESPGQDAKGVEP